MLPGVFSTAGGREREAERGKALRFPLCQPICNIATATRNLSIDVRLGATRRHCIVEVVKRLGLEPFRAPEPLPPIEESEVRLVCWMSIGTIGT